MSICSMRESIIGENSVDGYQNLLEKSIGEIRRDLFSKANFVKPPQEITIKRVYNGQILPVVIPANQRIIVLSENEMALNGGNIALKGFHNNESGKIYLNRKWLCIETFYHELLHSLSLTSIRPDINLKFRDLYEGLTECYTGYLLAKNYSTCYDNCWKQLSKTPCQFTYPQQTRIWVAFCHCIDIKETVPIYFYDNTKDWEFLFQSFIDKIKKSGYPNFTNILKNSKSRPSWVTFHQECMKNFGSKYEEAYDLNNAVIDLSNVVKSI